MSLPSESAEKPTGPCVACQKEGALLRCVPCRDVGVEVFFCDRDCQAKLWKYHRAVCGLAATTDDLIPPDASSEKKRAKSFRKVLRETNQKYIACCNCMKTENEDVKLSSCSGCDDAAYCSRECQKAHWPKHKERCKHNSVVRQIMDCTLTPSEKNILNLFEQWKSNPMTIMGTLHVKCSQIMDISERPPTKIMCAILEFDYNAKTFVFAEEPSVIPLCQCSQQTQNAVKDIFSQGKEVKFSVSSFTQYALVTCKDLGSQYERVMEMHFEEECLDTPMEKWIGAGKISRQIPLKSDLFNGWDAIRRNNLKKQFDHLKASPIYTGFLCNALQLFNYKARLSVCAIVIHVKMGRELGKINEFVKYEKMSKSEIKMLMGSFPNFVLLEFPPQLQQPPIQLLVAFQNIETDTFVEGDHSVRKLNTSGNRSLETYKRNVDYCFNQLQDSVKKIPSELLEKVNL